MRHPSRDQRDYGCCRSSRATRWLAAAVVLLVCACTRGGTDDTIAARESEEGAAAHIVPPVDVGGHLAIAARTDPQPLGDGWQWGAVPVGIAVDADGSVYWSQYRTGTIERADHDGNRAAAIATVDGPLGLAFDRPRRQLFFVTDRHFPRAVGRLRIGEKPEILVHGMEVNRPFAITVAAGAGKLYWTESINGRIRSAGLDGAGVDTVYDDGIANVDEAAGVVALSPAGIAVSESRGWIFWSDLRTGTIVRAGLDGSERTTILGREHGLDLPTGLAYDASAGRLYWADPGTETIRRADADGAHAEIVASAADGVLEPYGLAIDGKRRLLYWTDVGRNALYRSRLDEKRVERFVDLDPPDAAPPPTDPCAAAARLARREFLRRWVKSVRTCLVAVSATKAVMRSVTDLEAAAPTCSRQLQLADQVTALGTALAEHCDGRKKAAVIEASLDLGAHIVAADLSRAARYLRAVRPFVATAHSAAKGRTENALAAVDDLVGRLDRIDRRPANAVTPRLSASGQTTSYRATTQAAGSAVAVADDGAVRAGAPLAYEDNADGTISDPTTGLMWEKKCDGCGPLHDFNTRYPWRSRDGETDVSGWLRAINAEGGGGFAGYDDWRLPRIGELLSIVDFEHFNPSVGVAFDAAGCGFGCRSHAAPQCSCTHLGNYWTAGDSPRPDGVVPVVAFHLGVVFGQSADDDAFVRAVRGPIVDRERRFVDNGDGTVTDRATRLMWEKKCLRPGDLHDVDRRMYWSFDGTAETVWDWIAAVNREGSRGFAGYDDWRVPNVKELFSLFDGSHRDPSIAPVFAGAGCADVVDPSCSLTADAPYWTSTTFADFPALAMVVGFSTPGELEEDPPPWVIRVVGGVEPHPKTLRMVTRAVRGPMPTRGDQG